MMQNMGMIKKVWAIHAKYYDIYKNNSKESGGRFFLKYTVCSYLYAYL